MYSVERGNLIASMTMGKQKYLSAIRQANRGVDFSGEDTDMLQGEGGESETAVNDPEVSVAPASDYTQVLGMFRNELHQSLQRRSTADVNDFQHLFAFVEPLEHPSTSAAKSQDSVFPFSC